MRVVVADATPLHYLILVDAVHVLPGLFEKVHIPIEIRKELTHAAAPRAVRNWNAATAKLAGDSLRADGC
jgi:predicted nucleic acid-binding protein